MEPEQMPKLVSLAFQYGPFFFSVLFCIFITRWSYKIYDKSCKEGATPGASERRKTFKWVFVATFSFGIALVIVSIIWWVWYQGNQVHLFEGRIRNLQEYESVYSDQVFIAQNWQRPTPEGFTKHNDHFLIRQSKPFTAGQMFILHYSKQKPNEKDQDLKIMFREDWNHCDYTIEYDAAADRNVLKILDDAGADTRGGVAIQPPGTLYAAEPGEFWQSQAMQARLKSVDFALEVLQDERSAVGFKINALDQMLRQSDADFRKLAESRTEKEPAIITLLDLSRHSDRELAFKARKLIDSRFGLDPYLEGMVRGPADQRERVLEILRRMEPERVKMILGRIVNPPPEIRRRCEWLNRELGRRKNRVLIPTGTYDGDMYYTRIAWTGNTECLRQFFTTEVARNPEIVQMEPTDRGKESVLICCSRKAAALWVADRVEGCRSRATFERRTFQAMSQLRER